MTIRKAGSTCSGGQDIEGTGTGQFSKGESSGYLSIYGFSRIRGNMKKYAIRGGGGSFGIHTAHYRLDHADPSMVIGIGRNPLRPEPFSLNVDKRKNYRYHAYHLTYEIDLLLELLDKEKPDVLVNYAAQGEGAVSWKHSWRFFETNSMALARLVEALMSRDYLERFIQIGTSELYGPVDFSAREDTPLQPTSPYAASKAAFDLYLI